MEFQLLKNLLALLLRLSQFQLKDLELALLCQEFLCSHLAHTKSLSQFQLEDLGLVHLCLEFLCSHLAHTKFLSQESEVHFEKDHSSFLRASKAVQVQSLSLVPGLGKEELEEQSLALFIQEVLVLLEAQSV